jgi:MFS family permease
MMSLLQVTSPLGVVLGYTLTFIVVKYGLTWKYSFIIQSIIYAVVVICLLFLPRLYFSNTLNCINPSNPDEEVKKEKKESKRTFQSLNVNELESLPNNAEGQLEVEDQKEINLNNTTDVVSIFQHFNKDDHQAENFWKNLCKLVRIKVFMLCVMAISTLLFISTIVQFWTSDYLKTVLLIDEDSTTIAFIITCITAPTIGILVGGGIVQKLGGYETKIALPVVCIYALCAVCSAIPVTQCNSLISFAICLWLFLFFGGCIVPNMIGIILSSLPNELKGAGNSVTAFFTHLIGFLPGPYFYGVLNKKMREKDYPRFAYGFCIIYSVMALFLIFAATFVRRCENNNKKLQSEELESNENRIKEAQISKSKSKPNTVEIEISVVKEV